MDGTTATQPNPENGMIRLGLCLLLTLLTAAASAVPTLDLPGELRPWVPWVLEQQPSLDCPFQYSDPKQRQCAWSGVLQLDLEPRGGRFQQGWSLYAPSWVPLPGDARHWPERVMADGQPAVIIGRDGRPSLWLQAGEHQLSGHFAWRQLPDSLAIPPHTGLTQVTLNGEQRSDLGRDRGGTLWLGDKGGDGAGIENRTVLQVFRKLQDDLPAMLLTRLQLEVSGTPREQLFGPVLPPGFIPQALSGSLPVRLEADGRRRIQLRPGRWQIDLSALHPGGLDQVTLPQAGDHWPGEELWAFAPRNGLRLVRLQGGVPVDPQQTRLPEQWKSLSTRRLRPGESLSLATLRRGDPEPLPDRLQLQRQLWLDFDGNGYTLHDRLSGTISAGQRLDALSPLALGRVAVDGRDRVITRMPDQPRAGGDAAATSNSQAQAELASVGGVGVELRHGKLDMEADSRIDGALRSLPAVGWAHDIQQLSATLQLPPGWRLFSVSGADRAATPWLDRWTLLDLFLVLIISVAAARLWSLRWGGLALLTLVLTYQEPGAPGWSWLLVLAAMALLRVAPQGNLRRAAMMLRNLSLLGLLAVALPFVAQQVRGVLHPQLELGRYFQPVSGRVATLDPLSTGAAADKRRDPQSSKPMAAVRKYSSYNYSSGSGSGADSIQSQIDPNARVSTGPGLPRWRWRSVRLYWSGPVAQGQTLELRLIPPWANRLLKLLGVLSLAAFSAFLIQRTFATGGWWAAAPGQVPPPPSGGSSAKTGAGLLLLFMGGLLAGHGPSAEAAFPAPTMLDELARRLQQPPLCAPQCADIETLDLSAQAQGFVASLWVHAGGGEENADAGGVMLPLPGDTRIWRIHGVSLDGEPATLLRPDGGHQLWIHSAPGRHRVELRLVPPEGRDILPLPMPLAPHRIQLSGPQAADWLLEGIDDNGVPQQQVQLRRVADGPSAGAVSNATAGADNDSDGRSSFPPFAQVQRVLQLGLDWITRTTVRRNPSASGGVVVAIPLLAGESVTSAGVRVADGRVLVSLGPEQQALSWSGALQPAAELRLTAPVGQPWAETWVLDAAPIWHIDAAGTPLIQRHDQQGRWQPEWRPLPGEGITLSISRPQGIGGRTSTIDSSELQLTPGRRTTRANLSIHLRSSQGRQYQLELPAGGTLQQLSLNGKPQPARQQGSRVTLAIEPGSHHIEIEWQQAEGMGWWFQTPALSLGEDSVNSGLRVVVPADRWLLYAFGPAIGPAVLIWGILLVVLLIAVALGRTRLTPLTTWQWALLAIGLSQVTAMQGVLVVGWLLALGARGRMDPSSTSKLTHNLVQLSLALLTLLALVVIAEVVQRGLLGDPLMQVGGNGSNGRLLNWYLDRSGDELPLATVISVPLLVYRGLMLLWALWLANSLLRWLVWGWGNYASGGLWRTGSGPRPR